MTRDEHLLVIFAEECAEVAQRVSKALRFGLTEIEPGQKLTNAQRIVSEMNDLTAVYNMIAGPAVAPNSKFTGLFDGKPEEWFEAMRIKQQKVSKYLLYSATCGTLAVEPSKAGTGETDMNSPGELLAAKYRAADKGENGPEGTREALEQCARMLDTYAPDLHPANELGQVDFARAMMNSVTDEIRAFLKNNPTTEKIP